MARNNHLYWVWSAMIQRCHNQNNEAYHRYGGRGILVCNRWRTSFHAFAEDMGPRPEGDFSVERIDNNKGYGPDNCCWATRQEQNSNKRNCIYVINVHGKRTTLREYCRQHKIPYRPIVKRIQDRKWPIELALYIPVGRAGKGEDALALWDYIEELRSYLTLAIDAAHGRPVLSKLLDEARYLSENIPNVKLEMRSEAV
jgi:hypothetical protein